jgi:hypothetical protein
LSAGRAKEKIMETIIYYRGHEIINTAGSDLGSMEGRYFHVRRVAGAGTQEYTQSFRDFASAKCWIDAAIAADITEQIAEIEH